MEKYTNDDIRKLGKSSRGSYYIRIPKEMVKDLGWKERRKLKLTKRGKKIIIEDA